LRQFASGRADYSISLSESALAKRAYDAVRELGYPTENEIAKTAGLTDFELKLALTELKGTNLLLQDHSSTGKVHYALKYAY
jgi:hypothetical protein